MANLRANNLTGTGGRNAIDGSVFFDGGADSLSIPSIALGSGNWTIEFWFYSTKEGSQDGHIYDGRGTGSASSAYPIIKFDTDEKLSFYTTGAIRIQGASVVELGSWNHVALVKNSSTTTLYLNGQSEGTYSDSNTYLAPSNSIGKIGSDDNGSGYFFYGYLSNYRFVTGTAVYTAAFTPPTSKLTAVDGTVLLCCQDSDDPTQEATGKTITGYGNLGSGDDTNLLTNGGFSSDISGWTVAQGSASWSSGKLYMSGTSGNSIEQNVTTVVGKLYRFTATVDNTANVSYNIGMQFGPTLATDSSYQASDTIQSGTKTFVVDHIAESTTTTADLWGGTSVTGYWSNVSVKLHEPPKAPKFLPPVGVDEGVVFDGYTKINSPGVMYFPTGDTSQRGRGRAVMGGGTDGSSDYMNTIDYFSIPSEGNSIDFGDLSYAARSLGACSSSTRGLFAGGMGPSSEVATNSISYITIATTANGSDFGDLSVVKRQFEGLSNQTRGIWPGGQNDTPASNTEINSIDYVTIATTGNASDFGDIQEAKESTSTCASSTRGLIAGGDDGPAYSNTIGYITIATTGNATNFGDLTLARSSGTGCSNETRGLFFGGRVAPSNKNIIEYVTIATTGNSTDFGDLPAYINQSQSGASQIRGVLSGGNPNSAPLYTNIMQFVTIATTGNSSDFGDTTAIKSRGGTSDCHGGLS